MRWWGWWRRNGNGARARAERAEEQLRRTQRRTPHIEAIADALSLPDEEYIARMNRAFRRRA